MEKLGKRLMILSAAPHSFDTNGVPCSYEPYVREINLWSELYEEVVIYAIVKKNDEELRHKFAPFKDDNVRVRQMWTFDASKGALYKVGVLLSLPFVAIQLGFAMFKADMVNIRNSALYSVVLGVLTRVFHRRTITKWAGSYMTYEGEKFPTRLDRKVINWYHKKHKVLIYDQVYKPHFVNFIPALMSNEEIHKAKELAGKSKKPIKKSLEIVAIGRLYWVKNFELIFETLHLLNQRTDVNLNWHFHLIGEGNLRAKLEKMMYDYNLESQVTFHGGLPFKEVQPILASCHLLIMSGEKEGWPKPLAEAWAHDVYPLGAARGNVPHILNSKKKGIAFEPNPEDLCEAILEGNSYLVSLNEKYDFSPYAENFSLESFQTQLISIIKSIP